MPRCPCASRAAVRNAVPASVGPASASSFCEAEGEGEVSARAAARW
ncbi:hypothetical protein ACFQVA_36750 [Actinomadura keratinilytica]